MEKVRRLLEAWGAWGCCSDGRAGCGRRKQHRPGLPTEVHAHLHAAHEGRLPEMGAELTGAGSPGGGAHPRAGLSRERGGADGGEGGRG